MNTTQEERFMYWLISKISSRYDKIYGVLDIDLQPHPEHEPLAWKQMLLVSQR